MESNAERLVKILDVIVYLFVGTIVTIMYRVKSSPTESTTLALTDIGFQKKKTFKMEPNAERLVNFWQCESLSFRWYDCNHFV
jgi:hypothetical protein